MTLALSPPSSPPTTRKTSRRLAVFDACAVTTSGDGRTPGSLWLLMYPRVVSKPAEVCGSGIRGLGSAENLRISHGVWAVFELANNSGGLNRYCDWVDNDKCYFEINNGYIKFDEYYQNSLELFCMEMSATKQFGLSVIMNFWVRYSTLLNQSINQSAWTSSCWLIDWLSNIRALLLVSKNLLLMYYCTNDVLPQDLRNTYTREQFKCRLKGWLFECAYGRKCVW